MKILHTADWHLGKSLHNIDLLEEQGYILSRFVKIVEEKKPDVVIIAGDIYDRSVPSAVAVTLFSNTIHAIIDLNIPVIAIAGNHDSAERLDYAQSLLKRQHFHVVGSLKKPVPRVVLEDEHGKVHFYCVPYAEPESVRYTFGHPGLHSHEDAMRHIIENIFNEHPPHERSVLIGHSFVSGGETSESERIIINIGGSENIAESVFEKFDYVALGHLHRPQYFLDKKVQYAGSLLKYSLSEAYHQKSVIIVEMNEKGNNQYEPIYLVPRKELHRVKGCIEEGRFILDEKNAIIPSPDDFLEVTITNEGVVLNAMHIIQKDYPNVLHIVFANSTVSGNRAFNTSNINQLSEEQLFEDFYTHITGTSLDNIKRNFLLEAIKLAHEENEI